MSIKAFHILFITTAATLMLIFSWWAVYNFSQNAHAGYLLAAAGSLTIAIGLGVYEFFFIKKTKAL